MMRRLMMTGRAIKGLYVRRLHQETGRCGVSPLEGGVLKTVPGPVAVSARGKAFPQTPNLGRHSPQ